ncbi:hypothetical protein McanMca71_007780 [Microsporum canis]|uniref:Major facilitator superfamily domain-containing protein n=1 Tax=Arthroderma otae (strain ATCC MYA-4605 / CBS 113480) TaxID=554155 RepID=C5FIT5_ARTOC|nr:conserved hypothetical protein [Microsporum canis CBS 113480]EEQ29176.1 conserved hypothetical protein [Microsporum canis CBS 113480]
MIFATVKDSVRSSWGMFSAVERRNIFLYILGITFYKFGLEAFNGSILALATNRYDYDALLKHRPAKTFERVGLLSGLNQACQCVGSIIIAPLVRRAPARLVLVISVVLFGLFTAILMVVDAATGGTIMPPEFRGDHPAMDFHYYGKYNTDGMIPIYCVTGIVYGMVELIRRIIPRDIVGGNIQKLRRLDAMVHVFYEISGTGSAFCTALALIPTLGNNYSFIITPVFFAMAGATWFFIKEGDAFQPPPPPLLGKRPTYIKAVFVSFYLFGESIWTGCKLLFTNRRFIWLIPGYSIAFYGHRYLENGLAPAVARRYLGHSAWANIIVGGSNLGELFGALFVFLFTNLVTTPIPWVRLDAIMLLGVWYLSFWTPPQDQVIYAWIIAATFLPISFGWAAGDVSLAAYIQASLARHESKAQNVSALGAVMACLYTTYIVTYAISSPLLGQYIDSVYISTGGRDGGGNIHSAIHNVAGVQYSVMAVIIFASTFIPQGAWRINPKMLFNQNLDADLEVTEIGDGIDLKKKSHERDTSLSTDPRDRESW